MNNQNTTEKESTAQNKVKVLLESKHFDESLRSDFANVLINPDDEWPLTEADLELFLGDNTFDFSAYSVLSTEQDGIMSCLRKLKEMHIYGCSWHYIVKVWKAPNEHPSAEELRQLRYEIEDHNKSGDLLFALGHDEQLSHGETKMLVITHYYDRIPYLFGDEFYKAKTLKAYKKVYRRIVRRMKKEISYYGDDPMSMRLRYSQYLRDIQYNSSIVTMGFYPPYRKWRQTEHIFEWLLKFKPDLEYGAWDAAESYMFCSFLERKNDAIIKSTFYYKKLQWLLEHGANVNYHFRGETVLNVIKNGARSFSNDLEPDEQQFLSQLQQKGIDLLMRYGAKTMAQIREEESLNTDYKVELLRMN